MIEKLIKAEMLPSIKKIDDTAIDALISFNDCNDKCDTTHTELELLREEIKELREEIKILRDGETSNITPAKAIDEWLNGKEVRNG